MAASLHADSIVRIWDFAPQMKSLEEPGNRPFSYAPIHQIKAHKTEGYAVDWSRNGKMLFTGDNNGLIYMTEASESNFTTLDAMPFRGHKGSVEDISSSSTEMTVFASCGSDSTIKIWDTRISPRKAALSVLGHPTASVDINVISWNAKVSHLLASGADDGEFKIWDLRTFKSGKNESISSFKWHSKYISSIAWCPTEDTVLAVTAGDDQTTIWDMGVQDDDEETQGINGKAGVNNLPDQLLFIHQGQTDVKEVKWHPQIPGALITTANEGFNGMKLLYINFFC